MRGKPLTRPCLRRCCNTIHHQELDKARDLSHFATDRLRITKEQHSEATSTLAQRRNVLAEREVRRHLPH